MVIVPQTTPGSWKTRRKSPSARAPSPPPPTGCRPRRPRPKLARRRPCRRPRWGKRVGKVGKSLGIFEGFYSKNCRDDQEISRFWWNWIGNMWIYHDLSGNMCYLRWLTTKLGWGAGAQILSIPGGSFIDVDDVGVWRAKDTGRVGQILLRSPGNKEANLALLYVNGI